jgi:excisionase family DNA binding protein
MSTLAGVSTLSEANPLGIIWGVKEIAAKANLRPRQAYHLLDTGKLPGKKVGRRWCVTRDALNKFFSDMMPEPD